MPPRASISSFLSLPVRKRVWARTQLCAVCVCVCVCVYTCVGARACVQDGIEESLQINHLSHFLLCSLLIEDMKKSSDPRMIVVRALNPAAA